MPGTLADLLRQCFAIDPHARPASFQEIVARLEKLFASLLDSAPPQAPVPDSPLQADAKVNAAQTWLNLGQSRKASAEIKQALKLNPSNWKAHQIQSCIHMERRDFDSVFRSASKRTNWLLTILFPSPPSHKPAVCPKHAKSFETARPFSRPIR